MTPCDGCLRALDSEPHTVLSRTPRTCLHRPAPWLPQPLSRKLGEQLHKQEPPQGAEVGRWLLSSPPWVGDKVMRLSVLKLQTLLLPFPLCQ